MVERPEHAPTSRTQMITGETGSDPRQPAIAFVTTEHFVLQGARAATIADVAMYSYSSGRLPPGVEGGLDAQAVYRD